MLCGAGGQRPARVGAVRLRRASRQEPIERPAGELVDGVAFLVAAQILEAEAREIEVQHSVVAQFREQVAAAERRDAAERAPLIDERQNFARTPAAGATPQARLRDDVLRLETRREADRLALADDLRIVRVV